MKKYKSGFILGKFCPPTLGHFYLFDSAADLSEKLTILVCVLSKEIIPGELRYDWIKNYCSKYNHVDVVYVNEDVPQAPEESDDFWSIWVDLLKRNIPSDVDVFFSSENYGYDVADKLGIIHHPIDIERKKIPISATKIRNNPFEYWDFIPDNVKSYFIKRIAFLGPESTGKTTTSKKIAEHFNTNWVNEYGRYYCEEIKSDLNPDDFIDIAKGQIELEKIKKDNANKILICDTELITTKIFLDMYCPDCDVSCHDTLNSLIEQQGIYDLYFLMDIDFDGVNDGTRRFLDKRKQHFEVIKSELITRGIDFIVVSGSFEEKEKKIIMEIEKLMKNSYICLYK